MKNKFNKIIVGFICALSVALMLPIGVSADFGPKDSVRIIFENMGDELCYGTLLSKNSSTGPNSVWDGNEDHIYNYNLDIDIWRAFVEYEDSDGFYFLQTADLVSQTKRIEWTYYPPQTFKILLYYPESGTFVVSGIYEQYAFDTYYTVDMQGTAIGSVEYNSELSTDKRIIAYRSYNYMLEASSLAVRMIITIAVEVVIALFFKINGKKQLLLLIGANTITQFLLNIALNLIARYYRGLISLIVFYALFEMIVFAIEAALYCKFMNKWTDNKLGNRQYVLYALTANTVSFFIGVIAALIFPNFV